MDWRTSGVETGRRLAVFEVQLVLGGGDARFGVGQRLLAHLVHGVLVVEVVRFLKRTLHGHRRIYNVMIKVNAKVRALERCSLSAPSSPGVKDSPYSTQAR